MRSPPAPRPAPRAPRPTSPESRVPSPGSSIPDSRFPIPGGSRPDRRVPRTTLAAATLQAIRDRILGGAYAEGVPLRQDALAAELGVSRIPVREALRQLEVEGLVTFNPHRGAVVSSLSISDIEELFELRAAIEADLVRRAVPALEPDDIARAEEILDAYDAAFARGDVAAWGDLNWRFHAALLAAAQRPITLGVAEHLHRNADRYARMQLALTHGESRASKEHRAILAAARRRDAERASRLVHAHILDAGRSLVRFLRDQRGE